MYIICYGRYDTSLRIICSYVAPSVAYFRGSINQIRCKGAITCRFHLLESVRSKRELSKHETCTVEVKGQCIAAGRVNEPRMQVAYYHTESIGLRDKSTRAGTIYFV